MKRALPVLLVTLAVGLFVPGAAVWARTAAAPPTLEVQVIGKGVVGGKGISCGNGNSKCAAAYGSSTEGVTLTATPATGWAFDHWEDSTGLAAPAGCTASAATCPLTDWTGDNTAVAVFSNAGAVGQRTLSVAVTQDSTTTPSATPEGTVKTNSANYTIDCSAPTDTCSEQVVTGSTLTLEEAPASGYTFVGWGGACSGHLTTCTVDLTFNQSVSADFVSTGANTLTVKVAGSGTVTGPGINCGPGSTCAIDEPPTASITLTATPSSGYAFTGWDAGGDVCAGTQPTCTVQMSAAHTAIADFDQIVPVLLTVNGVGTVSGAGITCGPGPTTCSGGSAPDTTIQFTATPPAGGTVSWVGCTSASGTICNVVVNSSPISVTATFGGGTTGGGGGSFVQLTVTVSGDGYVTSTGAASIYCTAAGGAGCTATVQQNSAVALHAVPATGSAFLDWGGSCAGTSTTCLLTMSGAKSVSATFNGDNTTNDLTVSIVGSGSVTGGGLVRCTVTGAIGCTAPQAADARVTITAIPNPGQAFAGWSGDCTGTTTTCTVDMGDDQNVTATFQATAPQTSKLELTVAGAGSVSGGTEPCTSKGKPTTCTSTERTGSTVDLKATPAKGYVFTGWTGACTGTKPCTITLTEDTKVTATFAIPLKLTKKPAVSKLHVTFHFAAAEAGHLTVTGTRKGSKPVKVVKTVKPGNGLVRITVKTHGRWLFTLSLRSKSGVHTLRYRIKL